jgi:S1-C subfamily serine protease
MRQNRYFISFYLILFCVLVTFTGTFGQTAPKGKKTLSSREVVQKVSKSLVLVVAQGKNGEVIAQGSGFIYKENVIATTLHIFKRASKGYIKVLDTGVTHKIDKIIAIDIEHDLCLLQVPGVSGPLLHIADVSPKNCATCN